jgi:uncharacterized protein (UPF0332 family)
MRLNECFEKRLLRREKPDLEKSRRSIQVAEVKIAEARRAFDVDLMDAVVILAYTAMFHAARALLFKDGIIEKSHVCLIEYLREKYVKTGLLSEALTNTLDHMRIDRHETLYGLETKSSRKDAEYCLRKAEDFLSVVKAVLAEL